MTRSKIWLLPVLAMVAVAMLLSACSSDSSDDDGDGDATTATEQATSAADGGEASATPTEGSDSMTPAATSGDVNVAVITIGDRSFEYDVTPGAIQRCDPAFFGAFWVISSGGLDMLVVDADNPNHDPPYVKVTDPDDSDVEWWADPTINESLFQIEVPEGSSQVDSFSVDGSTLTGTATFIEKSALVPNAEVPASVEGSFEVTCGE